MGIGSALADENRHQGYITSELHPPFPSPPHPAFPPPSHCPSPPDLSTHHHSPSPTLTSTYLHSPHLTLSSPPPRTTTTLPSPTSLFFSPPLPAPSTIKPIIYHYHHPLPRSSPVSSPHRPPPSIPRTLHQPPSSTTLLNTTPAPSFNTPHHNYNTHPPPFHHNTI